MLLVLIMSSFNQQGLEDYDYYIPVPALLYSGTVLPDEYLDGRLELAIKMYEIYNVPVLVQIAVDIAESGVKKVSKFNNDSWVTCRCNYSKKLREKHSHKDCCFRAFDQHAGKWYYFKKYKTVEDNWADKAKIISHYKWFKPDMPYEFYAKHLQGCYAESDKYTTSLMNINRCYLKTMEYEILHI